MVQQLVATRDLGVLEIHEVVLGESHVGDKLSGEKKKCSGLECSEIGLFRKENIVAGTFGTRMVALSFAVF